MRKVLAGFLSFISFVFANELILKEEGLSTYIQEEEFMVAEGENVIGPITLLPIAITEGLVIKNDELNIKNLVLEGNNKDWKDVLKGQVISVEGEGRFIRGEVVEIKGQQIMLDTKKGYVVTTLPKFPSKLSSHLNWSELFSPKITFKVSAKEAKTEKFRLVYPVKGLRWKSSYILEIENGRKILTGYISLINDTPLYIKNVDIKLVKENKTVKVLKNSSIPPFSKKKIQFLKKGLTDVNVKGLIPGKVAVYKNGIFQY
ncbi:MAG: hypothetical protein D6831_03690, partial [Aquificota bacterium]